MKNIKLNSKVVVEIEENLSADHDNEGVGLLIEDSVDVSLGQVYEDNGTVRDLNREELKQVSPFITNLSVKTKASLSALLKEMTQDEKENFYTLKESDVDVKIYMDENGNSIDIFENALFVEKGIITQDRLDEISGFKKASDKIKGINQTTTEPAE